MPDEPVELPLTDGARDMYTRWFNRHAERTADAETDAHAAAASKIEGYAARLALLRQLADDPRAEAVDVDAMAAGIELADWHLAEAERIYAGTTETPEDRDRRKLVDWIIGKGGSCTESELSRGPRRYREPGASTVALDGLVGTGIGRWVDVPPGPTGGRPTRRFKLAGDGEIERGDGAETPAPPDPEDGDETPDNANRTAATTVASGAETQEPPGGFCTVASGEHVKNDAATDPVDAVLDGLVSRGVGRWEEGRFVFNEKPADGGHGATNPEVSI